MVSVNSSGGKVLVETILDLRSEGVAGSVCGIHRGCYRGMLEDEGYDIKPCVSGSNMRCARTNRKGRSSRNTS